MGSQNKRAMRLISQVQWRQRRGNLFALRTSARRSKEAVEAAESAEVADVETADVETADVETADVETAPDRLQQEAGE